MTATRLLPIVRPTAYLDGLPPAVRAKTLSSQFIAGLSVIYVVDDEGAVRGANEQDLTTAGVSQTELSALAIKNVSSRLPEMDTAAGCQAHGVAVVAEGNFYESSRLLLKDFWQQFASHSPGRLVVAVPANDAVMVACAPSPDEVKQLREGVDKVMKSADRPLSNVLLEWTAAGWQELK